jgi:hypothetical protein
MRWHHLRDTAENRMPDLSCARIGAVARERETENPLEVGERRLGEDDHASLRAFGRAAGLPLPSDLRYSKTSSAGIAMPVFFIARSLRVASAWNVARASSSIEACGVVLRRLASFAMRFFKSSGTLSAILNYE